ncbi:MAG: glycosylasparaginase [Ignavibacteriae bacterium]|nr:MAG: glycosylasparaginase [Ignavibacteriota bacterium]
MAISRRHLIRTSSVIGGVLLAGIPRNVFSMEPTGATVISTWDHGVPANAAALAALAAGGSALDAAEKGVMVVEADPMNRSVGLGGTPDRDGIVTLDASIMDHDSRAGSVAFVSTVAHPIALARMVMERTPHVMMVGKGAEQFAQEHGVPIIEPHPSDDVRRAWEAWKKENNYQPEINIENHDTIGMLVRDANGRLAGACTTSGLGYKMHGRVGDSPIIGAGLFVDGDVGAATCTGLGESVIRTSASTVAVEAMRHGATPQEACEEAIRRIIRKHANHRDFQVGILAMNIKGETGGHGMHKGFTYALSRPDRATTLEQASHSLI